MKRKSNNRVSGYFYAIRIRNGTWPAFLARHNASAPSLFWFHKDAVAHLQKCRIGSGRNKCRKEYPSRADIVKVFVRWQTDGITYNVPGDMFRSAKELKRKKIKA